MTRLILRLAGYHLSPFISHHTLSTYPNPEPNHDSNPDRNPDSDPNTDPNSNSDSHPNP
jgi:hypothetical protein